MQQVRFLSKLLTLFLVGLLVSACGDKETTTENKAAESANTTSTQASSAVGLDAHPGKTLHDAHCISCHDAKVYTRPERKVLDYTQLAAQVKRCDANLGSRLFDEDLAQITDYLNQAYYKYPKQ